MPPATDFKRFLNSLEPGAHFEQLLSCLPDVNYFAKDAAGRFVLMDEGFVAMLGAASRAEVLGRTDFDFFPKSIAEKFVADDLRVRTTGEPIRQLTEPVPNPDMTFSWWQVNKVPLRNRRGGIVGVAGISVRLSPQNAPSHYGAGLFKVLEHIGLHYGERLTVQDLAAVAALSVRAFERNFFNTFQTTPMRYVNRVRLQAARHLLLKSNLSLATIADECGFYDQSHMTSLFSRYFGISPRRYRESRSP